MILIVKMFVVKLKKKKLKMYYNYFENINLYRQL